MSRLPVPFEVRKERSGRVHRLIATGELDVATVATLERAFDAVYRDEDAAKIVVDLSALSFMDSTGIGLLVRMTRPATLATGCASSTAPPPSAECST